jgi:hypothetical protein
MGELSKILVAVGLRAMFQVPRWERKEASHPR